MPVKLVAVNWGVSLLGGEGAGAAFSPELLVYEVVTD